MKSLSREYKQSKIICAHKIQEDVTYMRLRGGIRKTLFVFVRKILEAQLKIPIGERLRSIKHRKVGH